MSNMNDESSDNLEEYEVWKKNSTFMYKMLDFHTLDWPSLTVEWLPFYEQTDAGEKYQLLLGTHTDEEENQLLVADVLITGNDLEGGGEGRYARQARVTAVRGRPHQGHVNRARHMPQEAAVVATRSSDGLCYVYGLCGEPLCLRGHSEEGVGLSWSGREAGRLATGGYDRRVCLWDVASGRAAPLATIEAAHADKVEEVAWAPLSEAVLGSAGDDGGLCLWDVRAACGAMAVARVVAHEGEAACLAWHPSRDHLLLSGGSDGLCLLWDRRRLAGPLHAFEGPSAVYRVAWAPLQETVFLSAGAHRRASLWDLAAIGDDVLSREEEGGPPELTLVHAGHREALSDVAWHPRLAWTVASVSEDNEVGLWQVNDRVFAV